MRTARPSNDSTRNRLYVEGADDFHVVCALVRKAGIRWDASDPRIPYAPDANGDVKAIEKAVVAVKSRTPRVGLVVDGDANPAGRWTQIRRQLHALGVELPTDYEDDGVIHDMDDEHRVGIWMMPHGKQPGAVEALVASLIPDSSLWTHAHAATDQARELGATFGDKDLDKARLRAWLSWQKAPGAPYGRAIDLGFLAPPSPMTDALVAWFRRLYLS